MGLRSASMRSRAAFLASASVVVAVTACIPARDNPFDPAEAPAASLFVVGREDGARCEPPDPDLLDASAGGWLPVAASSRGACLALDARASSDPQGDPLSFRFEIERAEGGGFDALPPEAVALAQTHGLLVLANEFLRGLPPGEVATFRVVAHDGDGARGAATATFVPLNGRPIAISDPLRVVPRDGFPWSPGEVLVTLDGSRSIDPDGDALTFRWAGPDPDAIEEISPGKSRWTLPVSGEEQAFLVTLIASDGNLASAPAPVPVIAGDPPVWSAAAYSVGLELVRVDTERTIPAAPLDPGGETALSIHGGLLVGTRWNQAGGAANAHDGVVRSWPGLEELASVPDLSPYGFAVSTLQDDTLWHYGFDGASATEEIVPITIAQQGTSATMTRGSALELETLGGGRGVVVPAGGTVWLSRIFAFEARAVTATNPPVPLASLTFGEDRQVMSISARPGKGEVWIVEQASPGTFVPQQAPATVHVYDAATAEEIDAFPLPYDRAKLVWTLDDQAWIQLIGERYVLVDGELLSQTHDLELALLTEVEHISNSRNELVIEPATGALWAQLPELVLLRVARTGGVREYEVPGFWEVHDIDLAGRLLVLTDDEAGGVTLAPGGDGVMFRVPKMVAAVGASVFADGSLWSFFPANSSAWLFGPDGDLVRAVDRVRESASPDAPTRLFPYGITSSVSPDGRWLWISEAEIGELPQGTWRYDLSADVPFRSPATPILDASQALHVEANGHWMQAGAPVPGQPDLLWTALGDPAGGTTDIVVVTPEGVDVRHPLGADEVRDAYLSYNFSFAPRAHFAAARSLADNAVCLVTHAESDSSIRVRWVDPVAAEPLLFETLDVAFTAFPPVASTFPNPIPNYSAIAGASIDPAADGTEVCWIAWFDRLERFRCESGPETEYGVSHVIGVNRSGEVVAATGTPIEGIVTGVRAVSGDRAWLSVYRCGEDGDHLIRLDADSSLPVAVLGTSVTFAPVRSRGFLQP